MLSFGSLADKIFQIIGIHGRGKGYVYNKKVLTKERFGATGQEDKKQKLPQFWREKKILTLSGLSPQEL